MTPDQYNRATTILGKIRELQEELAAFIEGIVRICDIETGEELKNDSEGIKRAKEIMKATIDELRKEFLNL